MSSPAVALHRALPKRARLSNLPPIDFSLGAGAHALVGTPADGTLIVASLLGGLEASASGRVTVAGRDPARDPALRAKLGVTLDTPCLPPGRRVADVLRAVDNLRGDESAGRALTTFGLSHLGDRTWASLVRADRRALDLVVAASTKDPIALVLTEPCADVTALDRQRLAETLRHAALAGACVIVITACMSDAVELADTIHIFEQGRIARWVPVDETGMLVPGRSVELRVEADLPRLLVGALADSPAVSGIDWTQEGRGAVLAIRGENLDELALALAGAATEAGVSVRSIAPVAPGLDEVRAASSGLALAARQAAYQAYLAYARKRAGEA